MVYVHRKIIEIIEELSFPSRCSEWPEKRHSVSVRHRLSCPGEAGILSEWRAGASVREAMARRASALAGEVRRSGPRERPWRAPAEAERGAFCHVHPGATAPCLAPVAERGFPKEVTSLFAGGVDRICPIALAPGRRCISDTSDLFFLGVISVRFERTYI